MGTRIDGREADQKRPVEITPGFLDFPEGSALITTGKTRVLCTASVDESIPRFLRGKGQGWVTAEYSMLPRSTLTRSPREAALGRVGGRTQEIQRLIGRSLRAVIDMPLLGERTITIDCDVLQADGGTRTAAITGAFVALHQATTRLVKQGLIPSDPLRWQVAATSVGVVKGELMLDLCYEEDFRADVDFNVVMTSNGDYVEIQGTAEHDPYNRDTVRRLLDLADKGITELFEAQRAVMTVVTAGGP